MRVPLSPPASLTHLPDALPPGDWAAPHRQCRHGTAGRGGTTGPAGRAARQPAPCSEGPGPGCNWGTEPDPEPTGPVGSRAPGDTVDAREQARSPRPSNSTFSKGNTMGPALLGTGRPQTSGFFRARCRHPSSFVPAPQSPDSYPSLSLGPRSKTHTFSTASSSTILKEPSSVSR